MSKFKLTKGKKNKPFLIIVYGVPGIGKTTFASKSPDPVYIDIEDGSNQLDVTRIESSELTKLDSILDAMDELSSSKFKTIVIDSLSKLEEIIWNATVARINSDGLMKKKCTSIEDPSYKQGYIFALKEWQEFVDKCEDVRRSGKNIILIGHSKTKKFDDPTLVDGYTRYEIDIHEKASNLLSKYVDATLFANYRTLVKDGKGLDTGERFLYTERRPGHDAKNRFCLPYELDLDWNKFIKIADEEKESSVSYLSQINGMMSAITDQNTINSIRLSLERSKSDISELRRIRDKIETLITGQE